MLDYFGGGVNKFVNESGHGEDSADDGAEAGGKVAEGLLLLAVLDHNRGQLVGEENSWHA